VAGTHSRVPPLSPPAPGAPAPARPRVAWSWSTAALGALDVLPAVVVTPFDVTLGLALGFGVLPVALLGVLPTRRGRVRAIPVGVLMGLSILLGSLVSDLHVVAVVAIFGLAVGAALLVERRPVGQLALTLAVPMVGIGLSFTDHAKGVALFLLIAVGTVYAYLVSLLWPERDAPPTVRTPEPPGGAMFDYGIRFGLAGATAAALGFAFDVDHVGWQVAAAMLVMRPAAEMQRLRSVGRIVSVVVGAFLAAGMAAARPAAGWYAVAIAVAVVGAAATQGSRWYVTPAFTTFIAISLLLYGHPHDVAYRFDQRVVETLVGVGIAYCFGLLVPRVQARLRRPSRQES